METMGGGLIASGLRTTPGGSRAPTDSGSNANPNPYRQFAGSPVCRLLGQPARVLDPAEDVLHLAQEDAAGIREQDVVAAAVEQRHVHLGLELADLLTERRLRRAQPAGGTCEVQFLGDGDEVTEMPQFHGEQARRDRGGSQTPPVVVSRGASDEARCKVCRRANRLP
jgi:hypothetical protein